MRAGDAPLLQGDVPLLRVCSRCTKPLPLERFRWKIRDRGQRQSLCIDCQREYHREWYERNRAEVIARVRRSKALNKKRYPPGKPSRSQLRKWEYLSTHPCIDCGEADPIVLEFDHVREKRANVGDLLRGGADWVRVQREIENCEVRCANCHRRRTAAVWESRRV